MQLPHEQGKNQDIEVDVVLPLFVSSIIFFIWNINLWRLEYNPNGMEN